MKVLDKRQQICEYFNFKVIWIPTGDQLWFLQHPIAVQ